MGSEAAPSYYFLCFMWPEESMDMPNHLLFIIFYFLFFKTGYNDGL